MLNLRLYSTNIYLYSFFALINIKKESILKRQDSICHFCEIVEKTRDCVVIYEDSDSLAFLDIRPVFWGHTLFIPKKHYQTLYDLPNTLLSDFMIKTKKIGKAIEHGMLAEGSFIGLNNTISQSVPHVHIHIIPRNANDGLKGFFWPRQQYLSHDEMIKTQTAIRKYLK